VNKVKDAEVDRKIAANWKEYLQETKDMRNMISWVWQELINDTGKKYAKKMFVVQVLSCAISVAGPWTLSFVFNGLNPKQPQMNLVIIGLALFSLTIVLSQLVQYLSMRYREYLFGENAGQLDKRTTELFFEKSLGQHIDENNLLNEANINKGFERTFQLQAMLLFEGVEAILMLLLPFAALWILSWEVGLFVCLMLVIHLAWTVFLNQRVLQICIPIDKKWRELRRYRLERIAQIEKVKNFHKEDEEIATLGKKFAEVIEPDRKFWLWYISQAILRGYVVYAVLICIVAYGAWQVWQGVLALGLLYPIYGWSKQIADNLWRIGHIEHQINFITPSILSMKEALTMPVGLVHAKEPKYLNPRDQVKVEFENVGYSYPAQKFVDTERKDIMPVIKHVSLTIMPGDKIAFIGSSGVGKTTIMRLLLRYMDPTEGAIKINGIDLRDLDLGSWLSMVGYVPQQAQIMDGTIQYNMLYGLPEEDKIQITDDHLWNMMRLLQVDFGERLTHGLDTLVGRNGIKLSGGQAQRLGIGCAVMKDPKFMIIDEATSSLDSTTEKLVQDGLEKVLTKDRGALIVTHRLSTVRRICNRFVLIDSNGDTSGKIVAMANSFEELAAKAPAFRSLAKDQGIEL